MAKELSEICVSLETAKKLVESGIVIDSIVNWVETAQSIKQDSSKIGIFELEINDQEYELEINDQEYLDINKRLGGNSYPAPTSEEIANYIPDELDISIFKRSLKLEKVNGYCCYYDLYGYIAKGSSMCEALAQMLFWLKKEGYIEGID